MTEFSGWKMAGVQFMTQAPDIAAIVESKTATYTALGGLIPLPDVYDAASSPVYPLYGKPPAGSGGRGNTLIENDAELSWARSHDLLVTEYLSGEEMVAYSLSDPQGHLLLSVTKAMGRWRGGASQLGTLRDEPTVREYVRIIANRLKLAGCWFAQFRMDGQGTYKLMEVNARLGGGSGLVRLAGINMPLLAVQIFSGQRVEIPVGTRELSWVRNLQPFVSAEPFRDVVWSTASLARPADGRLRPHVIAAVFDLANRGMMQRAYGASFPAPATTWNLHAHFEKRYESLGEALGDIGDPGHTIFISDDAGERLTIERIAPGVRIVSTGALEVLGREKF